MKNLPVAQFFCGKSSDQLVMEDRLFQKGGQNKNVKCLCKNGQNGDPEWKNRAAGTSGVMFGLPKTSKPLHVKINLTNQMKTRTRTRTNSRFPFGESIQMTKSGSNLAKQTCGKKIPGGLKQIEVGQLGVLVSTKMTPFGTVSVLITTLTPLALNDNGSLEVSNISRWGITLLGA